MYRPGFVFFFFVCLFVCLFVCFCFVFVVFGVFFFVLFCFVLFCFFLGGGGGGVVKASISCMAGPELGSRPKYQRLIRTRTHVYTHARTRTFL